MGRAAKDNDLLLRQYVNGNDMWLHSRDYPGAYVFIKSLVRGRSSRNESSVPLDTLLDAGNLALFYSRAKDSGQGDIYYTRVKYLRRAKGGKMGLVLPTNEKNLFIKLDPERIRRLKKSRDLY